MSKVTVLFPTYNVEKWVKEALQSVLDQTFRDIKILVLDDCSTDNTIGIVNSFVDERITLVKGEHNIGLAANLNRGLELADSEFCARMDGDDIAEPTWLETGVSILDSHPEIGICSFGFQFFGTKNSIIRFPEHHEDSKVQMLFGCTVIVPVFRRSVMIDNGLRYSTEAFPAEDYDMWSRCYKLTHIYNVQETMFHYRMHETQISTSKAANQRYKSDIVRTNMLNWLCNDLTEEEKQFFLHEFVPCTIHSREKLDQIRIFAKHIENRNQGNYSVNALHNGFERHIRVSLYHSVVNYFFSNGYSLSNYIKYLRSGLALKSPGKLELKIFAKSLLHRR